MTTQIDTMRIDTTHGGSAFAYWLRTGRRPRAAPVERKFNPYHDPRNGQFTFAPGGAGSGGDDDFGDVRRGESRRRSGGSAPGERDTGGTGRIDPVYRPRPGSAAPILVQRGPRMGRGGNSRAFEDPMTLEQVFPGLRDQPGGAIMAVANGFLDFTGPADAAAAERDEMRIARLVEQIQALNPRYRLPEEWAKTADGRSRQIDNLRFDLAVAFFRRGEMRPLQVETFRFLQRRTNAAYDLGLRLYQAGRLDVRLSKEEAIGNFVDSTVREELRQRYNWVGIEWNKEGPVRVNKREYDRSGVDASYRIPDSRIDQIAFDVTLTRKTLAKAQIRGFFRTDFRTTHVVIIRPAQLGDNSSYIITRPGKKK
jgi:hypothetical protein